MFVYIVVVYGLDCKFIDSCYLSDKKAIERKKELEKKQYEEREKAKRCKECPIRRHKKVIHSDEAYCNNYTNSKGKTPKGCDNQVLFDYEFFMMKYEVERVKVVQ